MEATSRVVGIVGQRGIGKTTYVLNYLAKNYKDDHRALYVSADDLYFSGNNLVDLVEQFINQYNGKLLCIDEIHKYPNWSREIKNIYDRHKRFKIIFSGSSSIDLIKEKYDLSRRAVLRHLPGLSFREFLEIELKIVLPVLTLKNVVSARIKSFDEISSIPKLLGLLKKYFEIGYYPIFMEHKEKQAVFEALAGVIEKVIHVDISSYYSLKTSTLPIFKKILYFIHTAKPSSINVNKIAKNLSKDYSDVSNYLEIMRDSGLLRFLLSDKSSHSLIRSTEKVYLNNTNLAYALEAETGKQVEIGAARELFVATNMENAGLKPMHSKIGDIFCSNYIFEIGGKNKDASQIKDAKNAYIVCDDILNGDVKKIPLYLFGFLY